MTPPRKLDGIQKACHWSRLLPVLEPHNVRYFVFFQAEAGIRDLTVTGVQTCALPICILPYATVTGPAGLDLVTDADGDPTTGPFSIGRVTSYSNNINTANANIKLTGAGGEVTALTANTSINALLLAGTGINITGAFTLTDSSGQLV